MIALFKKIIFCVGVSVLGVGSISPMDVDFIDDLHRPLHGADRTVPSIMNLCPDWDNKDMHEVDETDYLWTMTYEHYNTKGRYDRLTYGQRLLETELRSIRWKVQDLDKELSCEDVLSDEDIERKSEELVAKKDKLLARIKSRMEHFKTCKQFKNYFDDSSSSREFLGQLRRNALTYEYEPYERTINAKVNSWAAIQKMTQNPPHNNSRAVLNTKTEVFLQSGLPVSQMERMLQGNAPFLKEADLHAMIQRALEDDAFQTEVETTLGADWIAAMNQRLSDIEALQEAGKYEQAQDQTIFIKALIARSVLPVIARGYLAPRLAGIAEKRQHFDALQSRRKKIGGAVGGGVAAAATGAYLAARLARKHTHLSDDEIKDLVWYRRYPIAATRALGAYRHRLV